MKQVNRLKPVLSGFQTIRTPEIMPIGARVHSARDYCEGLVRSQIALGLLRFSDECRHVLSQNPLALQALGVAAFVGVTYRLRAETPPPADWTPVAETYH